MREPFSCEHLPARRFPFRDRLVELGIDRRGFLRLALEVQHRAELRQDLRAELGVVADADRALNVERRADQLFGVGVAALLDQNPASP